MTNRPALETGDNRSRYEEVMRQDFPKDFISDDECDYIEAMSHWSKK